MIFLSLSFKTNLNQKLTILDLFYNIPIRCNQTREKKCVNIFADSELCVKYRDFGTWVGRWSKGNGGVTIFSTVFFLHNHRLIPGPMGSPLKNLFKHIFLWQIVSDGSMVCFMVRRLCLRSAELRIWASQGINKRSH